LYFIIFEKELSHTFYVNSTTPLAENMSRSIVIYDLIVSSCESIRYSE